ncbi:MAG: hypothetical protein KF789_12475 [Bdellovibrionaceae bacterium]|nr:hypothetical protein [Pseudobdellovibrionaceae bacterium]
MKSEIQEKLEQLAYERTTPFCYGCYVKAPTGVCPQCHTDDLMRHLDGVGVEWGTFWVIKHILEEELTPINIEEEFEESVRQFYPEEVTVGWITLDAVSVMKDQDPTSWRIAQSEWESQEEEEGNIVSFDNGSTYYWSQDIKAIL